MNYSPTILNIDKPKGMTSFDVIRVLKKGLPKGFGKIGHLETLDPFASGVLLIGISGGARIGDYVHQYCPKTYEAIGQLGVKTISGDLSDPVLETDTTLTQDSPLASETLESISKKVEVLFKDQVYWQTPPKVSVVKYLGKRLYAYTRKGVEVTVPDKKRIVHAFEITKWQFPYIHFKTTVSAGTYIRKLFEDMAQNLGTIGALQDLRRLAIGDIRVDTAFALDRHASFTPDERIECEGRAIKGDSDEKGIHPLLANSLTIEEVLSFPRVLIGSDLATRYSCGQTLRLNGQEHEVERDERDTGEESEGNFSNTQDLEQKVWVYNSMSKNILGLGLLHLETNQLKPVFNFSQQS